MDAPKRGVEAIYRLTPTQEGLLYHCLQSPDSGVYFQQFTCVLDGDLDWPRFEQAWQRCVDRHAALRTLFTWEKRDQPLQVIQTGVLAPLVKLDDERLLGEGDELDAYLAQDRAQGFALDAAPLMRVALVRGPSERHRLIWSFHHLVLDGWSMRLVWNEVLENYADPRAADARTPARSFEEYLAWLTSRDQAHAESYWRERLQGIDGPSELRLPAPGDPAGASEPGHAPASIGGTAEHWLRFSAAESADLLSGARAVRATLSTLLRGAWALTLSGYSGEDDVIFGATVSGRPAELPAIEERVGMFIQSIPIRVQVDRSAQVGDWLSDLQAQAQASADDEFASLADLQRWSSLPAGVPLFSSLLVVENVPAGGDSGVPGGLRPSAPRFLERSNYPLALLVIPGERLEVCFVFDAQRYRRADIERLSANLAAVLQGLVAGGERSVDEVPTLAADQRDALREMRRGPWSAPGGAAGGTVLDGFLGTVRLTPQAVAIRQGERALDYAELHALAAGFATRLRDAGVKPGDTVCLRMERGPELIAAILGVLLAGAAYVPLDPGAPAARCTEIARDASAVLAVLQRSSGESWQPAIPVLLAEEVAPLASAPPEGPVTVDPDQLAYVLFTSGSTGRPKGVEVLHRNLQASTAARAPLYGAAPQAFLLLSPLHFDSSVAGLFWTLSEGGTLVLPERDGERDMDGLGRLIASAGVTHTLCLPSLYDLLLDVAGHRALASLRTVMVAGEACPPALGPKHRALLPGAQLVNEYGPTEATVWATAHRLTEADAPGPVPIGKPIGETEAFVLGPTGEPVPPGVPGELVLGGPGISPGYRPSPPGAASPFADRAPLGLAPGRTYATGDRVRFLDDGSLAFLGRMDRQVKIRGQRIELGEIEACLAAHPQVREASVDLVSAGAGGAPELVAHVVPRDASPDPALLLDHARQHLTAAMVPRSVTVMASFPRTASGKLDRSKLPVPTAEQQARGRPPIGEVEEQLAAIWAEILGLDDVPADANLYELGGDSLLSIRMIARAHQRGLRVDPVRFADDPTVAGMAAAVTSSSAAGEADGPADAAGTPVPLTPIQRWFFDLDLPEREHWNQASLLGLPADASFEAVEACVRAVVHAHGAFRLRFAEGPGGWTQTVGAEAPLSLQRIQAGAGTQAEREAALERAATELHRGMNLQDGPLLRAAWVEPGPGEAPRLLLAAHHLVVDAVSWGILSDDLRAAWNAYLSGGAAEVPMASASFAGWARDLERYANSAAIQTELPYWERLAQEGPAPLPLDGAAPGGPWPVANEDAVLGLLDQERTHALLYEIQGVYHTQVLDLLLAALARALVEWTGHSTLLLDVEGHGRESSASSLDASRCVGWLTSFWPVRLEAPDDPQPASWIRDVKEQLRRTPGGGVGFGLLRSMREGPGDLDGIPPRQVLFNYLGKSAAADGSPFTASPGPLGAMRSRQGTRPYALEINAHCGPAGLVTRWSFSPEAHQRATIERLAQRFTEELAALIDHCRKPEAGGHTPSDFPLAGLDQAALDKLGDLLGE